MVRQSAPHLTCPAALLLDADCIADLPVTLDSREDTLVLSLGALSVAAGDATWLLIHPLADDLKHHGTVLQKTPWLEGDGTVSRGKHPAVDPT